MTKKTPNPSHHQDQRTLEEIAGMFDVTRERIRQIEEKGLRKLRQKLIIKGVSREILHD